MVEIIPQPSHRPLLGQPFLFIIVLILFLGEVFGFFLLGQMQSNATETLRTLEDTLVREAAVQEKRLEAELSAAKNKIDDFGLIIRERKDFLAFVQFLEQTTHPSIVFVDLEGNVEQNTILVSGETPNFRALEQQRLVWEDRKGKELKEFTLHDLELRKGGGIFEADLVFSPEFPLKNQ